ncbi:hypothetical protein P1O49_004997 [Escherichia coli]|nr:hypothetical protein [Escherichia coli]EFI6301682.1 hypothetical protein [Escherichia coli]EFM2463133.1 hypothetical protein [Escherichia coli]EFT7051970.1 hypothetical protein [Escherichia coli]EGM5961804.1 hypothetical protein [Escherichia coli]
MRQQQDEPGRFSICSRQAAVVLSASKPQLELFDEIWKEGMKPEEWLDTYLEQANLI